MRQQYKKNANSRSDLLTLLSEASEIEHGLACSYLYTAFSIKQNTEEGISWEQMHLTRKWAGQLFFVASEEMLHLSQVWNLTLAIGGLPYYLRPNFPINSKYYHFDLPVSLEPFSERVMEMFKMYELPRDLSEKEFVQSKFDVSFEDGFDYKSVGELYEMIAAGIKKIPESELFIGNPNLQVGSDVIDFPDIIKVTDKKSALAAINLIVEQGEGTLTDEKNSHYFIFSKVLEELSNEKAENNDFNPARDIISNPITYNKGNLQLTNGNIITDPLAVQIADLLDDLYVLMMQILQFVFITENKLKAKELGKFAIHIMPSVIKPLSESLHRVNAGIQYPNLGAGPSFTMNRHIGLPNNFNTSIILIMERLNEIINRGSLLIKNDGTPESFKHAMENLDKLTLKLKK